MHLALAVLPLLAGANAAISILYPTAGSIWYRNDTVNLNWTQSDPSTDTYLFRTFLSNADSSILSTPQRIADSTNATATFVRIALPQLPAASGYVVRLVNTTDESQVLATSEAFEIQDGEYRNQTSSSALPSQTQSRSTEPLPNANTNSPSAFPSASASQSSGAASPAQLVPAFNLLAQAAGVAGLVVGGAAVLL